MLSEERREKILKRVAALLRDVDPNVRLIDVILDSTREQLAFVMQKGEWPIVVGLNWLDYVSHRDDELREQLAVGLARRLEKARSKTADEEP